MRFLSVIDMTVLIFACLLAASAVPASTGEQKRYDGYQVYNVAAKNNVSFEALIELQETNENFDFWTEPSMYRSTDIMVPPGKSHQLLQVINDFGMSYEIKTEDVQRLLDSNNNSPQVSGESFRSGSETLYAHTWTSYSRVKTIYDFMNALAAAYPELVTVTSIGKTYEKRDMLMMKVSTGGSGKNALFIDGGIHAREWISPATVTWAIRELVENNAQYQNLLSKLDWYFVPVVNPDGYEYSHTKNRLWRKNRRPNPGFCVGTDLNRNFGYHWADGGTSTNPCSEIFHGASAFSEVESQNLRDAILAAKAAGAKGYLSFHSYGQDMIFPWSYQNSPLPDDHAALDALAKNATDALTIVYGTKYGYGNSFRLYGATAGSSDDWSKGVAGIPFAFTVELRDEGKSGFKLPPSEIIPTAKETWELIKVVAQTMMET